MTINKIKETRLVLNTINATLELMTYYAEQQKNINIDDLKGCIDVLDKYLENATKKHD